MSGTSVLFDAPGPRARRRQLIGSAVAVVVLLAVAYVVVSRLAAQEQFSMERWGPWIDPSLEEFPQVWRLVGTGLRYTLIAAVLAILFSLVLGTVLATARVLSGRTGRIPLVGFIELLRGLPLVLTIYFASRVLPDLGVDLSPLPGSDGLWYVVIGLTLYNMVIIAEIIRAGLAALPRGQREAAQAIGLGRLATMRLVLLPQAFRIMLPALISQLVVILKDTSLGGLLGIYPDLLRQGIFIYQNLDNPLQTYFVIGLIYVLINFALSRLAVWTERRVSRGPQVRVAAGAAAPRDPTTTGAVHV